MSNELDTMARARHAVGSEPLPLLIDGAWLPSASGAVFDVIDPGTGEVVAQAARGGAADVDAAVAAARRSFEDQRWRRFSGAERGVILWRLAELIENSIEELVGVESLDLGIPLPHSRGMITEAASVLRYYAGLADKIYGRTVEIGPAERRVHGYTLREPIGVVGAIIPWNAPLLTAVQKIAPALTAGCSVVLKPAEETPLSSMWLGRLVAEAGIPDGVVNIVTGFGDEVGGAIAAHPDVDKVGFTGSTEVGKKIIVAATGNLKKLTLELGGKSPVLVLPDADLETAIPGIATGIFWNSGQICTAGTRLFVHRSVFDQVVEGIADEGRKLKLGYANDPEADLGPLISQKQLERVTGYVESGLADGAELISGGCRRGSRGYFYEPTVVANVNQSMSMVREEIFGPVIVAMPFDDIDAAVAAANDTQYGLAASIWTRDISVAHSTAKRIRAGRVGINVHRAGGAQIPNGGYRQSGWGREGGPEGLDAYLETKTVVELLDR